MTVKLRSLAKINLDLRVLNRRPDGYHELRTVFQTVSLADTIEIDYEPARRLHVEIESDPVIPGNLIEKAAEALGLPGRFRIRLQKQIPMGGGMGGGSSNAAAILLAVPFLCGKRRSLEKLIGIAAEVGSDVPFFLLGGAAGGAGRGTELCPLPDVPPYHAILVAPGIHVSTPEAYRSLERPLTDQVPSATLNSFQSVTWEIAAGVPPSAWPCRNDFETVVFHQHPRLKSIKGKLLKLGAKPALMSGSGSTIFGVFADRGARDRALVSLQLQYGDEKVFPVSLVGRAAYRNLWWRQLRAPMEFKLWPPQGRYAR
ncbi:MAG TPA: 4-(cytidine 5'-diphospho)-2-C-methyl-D-erythritol kinase [Bryobacteraceae bacterium]|nr:4-(cytidine 5'-diphospho)-2-C-methyl-D-erythritol kinase [Bryobacteraceae bacterium]